MIQASDSTVIVTYSSEFARELIIVVQSIVILISFAFHIFGKKAPK